MILPLGYQYSSVHAGIRKDRRDDLALIVSDAPASAAAVFTRNLVQAAPVTLRAQASEEIARSCSRGAGKRGQRELRHSQWRQVALETCRAGGKATQIAHRGRVPASTGVMASSWTRR